jgi:mRNA-degrading endonuclease RelE of RelBE toxin-antitoxin system
VVGELDQESVRRINQAVERLAQMNVGDVKKLQGIDPPEYRLRVGNYRVRFYQDDETIRIWRVRKPSPPARTSISAASLPKTGE